MGVQEMQARKWQGRVQSKQDKSSPKEGRAGASRNGGEQASVARMCAKGRGEGRRAKGKGRGARSKERGARGDGQGARDK
jgi:hypothetical protein